MIEERLAALNIILPTPPKPAGSYIPVVKAGNLLFVSGQIPMKDGKVVFQGKVPTNISIEEAQKAAKLCIINALTQIKTEVHSLEKISRIV